MDDLSISKRGVELLRDPTLNKSTAFTEAERQGLGLVGLVPDATESKAAPWQSGENKIVDSKSFFITLKQTTNDLPICART